MKEIDREYFFKHIKSLGKMSQPTVDNLNRLLTFMEDDDKLNSDDTIRLKHMAYMLATARHETNNTYDPSSKEIRQVKTDTPRRKKIKDLQDRYWYTGYFGRTYVHLTWESNYVKIENLIKQLYPKAVAQFEKETGRMFDLTIGDQPNDIKDPDNLCHPLIAYLTMSIGMRLGVFVPGQTLDRYINKDITDYINARKIINGKDEAYKISVYATVFERALRYTK